MRSDVSVVIPTLNEEHTVGYVLDRILWLDNIDEILVIDGGSQDRTVDIVHEKGIRVISQKGKGWGTAVLEGIQAAQSKCVVIIEADGTSLPREIPRLLKPLTTDPKIGLVVGSRVMRAQQARVNPFSFSAFISLQLSSFFYNVLYGLSIDSTSKFFALRQHSLTISEYSRLNQSRHLLLQLAVRLRQKGMKVIEVPVTLRLRRTLFSQTTG